MRPYETIHTEKAHFPVHRLREAFGVARSGCYTWLRATPSERARQNEALLARIRAIHPEHKSRYGSPRMHRELRALGERVGRNRVGLIHHTDRCSQYASRDYQRVLHDNGGLPSMSGAGDCWDNVVSESFFATLKNELVHGVLFATRTEVYDVISDYIDNPDLGSGLFLLE